MTTKTVTDNKDALKPCFRCKGEACIAVWDYVYCTDCFMSTPVKAEDSQGDSYLVSRVSRKEALKIWNKLWNTRTTDTQLELAVKALRFYANEGTYLQEARNICYGASSIEIDQGKTAQTTLKQLGV